MEVVNCKVAHIRPEYDNLREWMADSDNAYIGRRGVVFIDKVRFPPNDSIWANPFKITALKTRSEVITEYKKYILSRLNDPDDKIITWEKLLELKDKKLGCWCAPEACHGNVLMKLIEKRST